MKVRKIANDPALFLIWCVPCDSYHPFRVGDDKTDPSNKLWRWNGDFEKPTIEGSLFTNKDKSAPVPACHLIVTDGNVKYLGDCSHDLSGQTVELSDDPGRF